MKALVINCSPVRTGATAEIVKIISGELSTRYDTKWEVLQRRSSGNGRSGDAVGYAVVPHRAAAIHHHLLFFVGFFAVEAQIAALKAFHGRGYLNLQKIIEECWNAGSIVGPGRGSGVGFILLYVLGITQINPLREKTKTFAWRFLNPERVSVLDVDFDIEGGRRAQVLQHLRNVYGDDRVANVATFRTEKSKSAILTAARGLGIDVDIAQYVASLIPADRGQLRSLDQCMYGDEENGWAPIKQFVTEMTVNYPELWEVAHGIEGLICGSGIHAGGIILLTNRSQSQPV